MTQDNKAKFAAILAAQQAKVSQINKTAFTEQVKKEQPKPEVKEVEIIVMPELSSITIEDLLNDKPVYCSPITFDIPTMKQPEQPKLQIIDYSDKAFAVIGDTKPIKELLFSLGGSFNRFLKCGEGWIFSKRHLSNVKQKLAL